MRGEECYATQCGEARAVAPMPSRRQAERGMEETCLMIGMLCSEKLDDFEWVLEMVLVLRRPACVPQIPALSTPLCSVSRCTLTSELTGDSNAGEWR